MARALTNCPKCGSVVTPFAAGCAICGLNLDAERARRERAQVTLPSPPRLSGELRGSALLVSIVALLVVFASFVGILLAAYCAYDRNRRGEHMTRNVLIALALAGVAFTLNPSLNPVNVLPGL